MKEFSCDILIIGSGLAGLYAACSVDSGKRVIVVSKASDPFANSWHAQGGIAAALGAGDTTESHFEDTIRAGGGISDPDATMVLVDEGKNKMQALIDKGLQVDKTGGRPSLGLEGGHSKRRILHLDGDLSGRRAMEFLQKIVRHKSNVQVITESEAIKLATHEHTCLGAYIYQHDRKRVCAIYAGATILATGGLSALYPRTTNPGYSIGDGVALAYEAGAALQDMEFIQFHPTAFALPGERAFLISEAVRGEGAKLINNAGEHFMKNIGELATRDVVSRNIYKELTESGEEHVNLDLRHLDKAFIKTRFSTIYGYLKDKGLEMTRDLIPVAPAAHYMIGGVKTDLNGQTTLSGLYAAGEVASTGVMGANRLASNSLLECIVFSGRAIENIQTQSTKIHEKKFPELLFTYDPENREAYQNIREKIGDILNRHAGIIRNEKGLQQGLTKLQTLMDQQKWSDSYYSIKIRFALKNAYAVIASALKRCESRGAHYRSDFPDSVKEYQAHSLLKTSGAIDFIHDGE